MTNPAVERSAHRLSHLQRLESEAIHIIREAVAEGGRPVMLYSMGKDSTVLLHLARKAFAPSPIPFPLLHIDTTFKFREMYRFRDEVAAQDDLQLIVYANPECVARGINPFDHGSSMHTNLWKTEGLRQALDLYGFDIAFGGARRDEEASRSKERVMSLRSKNHQWDPKQQRPELWQLYNVRRSTGESLRVFPLSNWTELDVWRYVERERLQIVPLYLAAPRTVVDRDGMLIMVDDERLPLRPGETPFVRSVRFRTLGCYPLSGAVESTATSVAEIIDEMQRSTTSEREGRLIDHDEAGSMEKKKQDGYF